jgi:5-(carboxyamino)imidazole ribonucleotide synthase
MYNILGDSSFTGEYLPLNVSEPGVFLKMYGKKISKPLRKLGHVNIIGINGESTHDLLNKVQLLLPKLTVKSSD